MNYDRNESINNARKLLTRYRRNYLLAGDKFEASLTVKYTSQPKATTRVNAVEEYVTRKVDAENYLFKVNSALSRMNNLRRKILYLKYVDIEELTNAEISKEVFIEERTLRRELNKALYDFAFSYDGGVLLSEQKQ